MLRYDETGIRQIDSRIKECEEKMNILNKVKGEAMIVEKSTANNAGLDFAKNEQISLKTQKDKLIEERNKSVLVKPHGDSNRVDLYDIVTVYDRTIDDEYQVILTGKYDPIQDVSDVDEITLNSPLGEIFGKTRGEVIPYTVRDVKHEVEIRDFAKSATVNSTVKEETKDLK
ncbi:MAG: hypothetical protein K2K31_02070 [Clostridia bacterium]|nr:hypothetical protein [Clostridia bacterium]